MPDSAPNPELLHSLRRLVRGLSALFWGLPFALIICVETKMGRTNWLGDFGVLPPLMATGLLLCGVWQLGGFQRQERPWRSTLDHAKLLAGINFGLCPFLHWWGRVPENQFFAIAVGVMMLSALLFLLSLNLVLSRLGAMLPDETLRHETRQFTTLNRSLLTVLLGLIAVYLILLQLPDLPMRLVEILVWFENHPLGTLGVLIVFALLPLSMTMALIWKTKEVILDSVFSGK